MVKSQGPSCGPKDFSNSFSSIGTKCDYKLGQVRGGLGQGHGFKIEGNAKTGRANPVAQPNSKFQPFWLTPVFGLIV